MFKTILTLLFIFYANISFSHSQLTDILPKNNIVYTKKPSKIELTFRSKVKLIKIDLNRKSGETKNIKLNLNSYKERTKKFTLPMPNITSGKYEIFWRALSPDGHIIKGKSVFEVK